MTQRDSTHGRFYPTILLTWPFSYRLPFDISIWIMIRNIAWKDRKAKKKKKKVVQRMKRKHWKTKREKREREREKALKKKKKEIRPENEQKWLGVAQRQKKGRSGKRFKDPGWFFWCCLKNPLNSRLPSSRYIFTSFLLEKVTPKRFSISSDAIPFAKPQEKTRIKLALRISLVLVIKLSTMFSAGNHRAGLKVWKENTPGKIFDWSDRNFY